MPTAQTTVEPASLRPQPGASERVYVGLRTRILLMELAPGAVLDRRELVQRYNVSQTPVRDALQVLAQEGLVLIFPQSRTVVAPIDVRQLSETHFLRVAVECEVVRKLALDPAPERIRRAEGILEMQRALSAANGEMGMFSDLDRTFHRELFSAVDVEPLHEMLLRRAGHLFRCIRLDLPHPGKMQRIVDAHARILADIRNGDVNAATDTMRAHLSGTIGRIELLRSEYPQYFTGDPLIAP